MKTYLTVIAWFLILTISLSGISSLGVLYYWVFFGVEGDGLIGKFFFLILSSIFIGVFSLLACDVRKGYIEANRGNQHDI